MEVQAIMEGPSGLTLEFAEEMFVKYMWYNNVWQAPHIGRLTSRMIGPAMHYSFYRADWLDAENDIHKSHQFFF